MEQRPIRKSLKSAQVNNSFNGCNRFKPITSLFYLQSINSALISASILPPKMKRNPPVTANFVFPSSSLNPMFVHFIPSSESTAAKNPRRMEVIIRARHACMWAATEKQKTSQHLYRNLINLVLKKIKVVRGSNKINRCSNGWILPNCHMVQRSLQTLVCLAFKSNRFESWTMPTLYKLNKSSCVFSKSRKTTASHSSLTFLWKCLVNTWLFSGAGRSLLLTSPSEFLTRVQLSAQDTSEIQVIVKVCKALAQLRNWRKVPALLLPGRDRKE